MANIKFLTEKENECMEYLLQAQAIFDEICLESPQDATDSFNFGHYIDAARQAVILRGARRLDPENLLNKKSKPIPIKDLFNFSEEDDNK